jgi:hypothetical protein
MRPLVSMLLSLSLLIPLAVAKEKKKIVLPDEVLRAKTVLVVVSPQAQTSLVNPNENRTAQEDVEKALVKWGRFNPVLESQEPDLIIAIRKGCENRALSPSISGGPTDNRPVILEPTDGAVRIGVQQGRPPIDPSSLRSGPGLPKQMGASGDTFEVYRGRLEPRIRWTALRCGAIWLRTPCVHPLCPRWSSFGRWSSKRQGSSKTE